MCVYIYIHLYMCIYVHVCVCVYVCMYLCVCVCVCVYIYKTWWYAVSPNRPAEDVSIWARASRSDYLNDARPWQCRRPERSCTCEAQDQSSSKPVGMLSIKGT